MPQARCASSPGVSGARPGSSSASRVRFHWLERVLHDRAGDDVAEPLILQRELVHDRLQGGGEHFLVADARVDALQPVQGYAGAADDCDAPGL